MWDIGSVQIINWKTGHPSTTHGLGRTSLHCWGVAWHAFKAWFWPVKSFFLWTTSWLLLCPTFSSASHPDDGRNLSLSGSLGTFLPLQIQARWMAKAGFLAVTSARLGWSVKLLTGEGRGPGELSETKKGRSSPGMPLKWAQDHHWSHLWLRCGVESECGPVPLTLHFWISRWREAKGL